VKLYARTPAGTSLGLNVLLTGQVQEEGGAIRRVEVILPIGCAPFVTALPKSPMGQQLLWASSGDLCADDGGAIDLDQIRAEIVRVNEQKADRIAFVQAGLAGYEKLNAASKTRTSREAWIAYKLGCTETQAAKYIREAKTLPDGDQ